MAARPTNTTETRNMTNGGIDPDKIETHVRRLTLDRILVRLDPPRRATRGGIELPDSTMPASRSGVVVGVGPGSLCDDGKTRVPMSCKVGQRVWVEHGAGQFLPLGRRETGPDGWAYKLMNDGSIIAEIIPGDDDSPGENLPPAPPGSDIPATRFSVDDPGFIERLRPVQDWTVVRLDERQEWYAPRRADRTPVLGPNGMPLRLYRGDKNQKSAEDTWGVTILARGPGIITTTRCLDGDRVGRMPMQFEVGERVIAHGTAPHVQAVNYAEDWLQHGGIALMRETPCFCAEIAPGAEIAA